MFNGNFIFHLAIFFVLSNLCQTIIQHGYMTNYFYSHRPVEVNDSLILELTSRVLEDRPAKDHMACDVNIVTLPSRRILIHFLSLEISYDEKEVDRLHVYDYKANGEDIRLTPSQGLYGIYDSYYRGLQDYRSTGNRLKLDYQGRPTLAYDGFKILITSFRDSRGDCGRGFFRCVHKKICIPASLWCDGYQNCGRDDNSDEATCDLALEDEWKPIDGTVTAVLAAVLSCAVFIISMAVMALVVLRISKRQVLNANITVEYKRRKPSKRQLSNGDALNRLYAPPSYEVVIEMDEDPPPYHWVNGRVETDSEDEDHNLTEDKSHVPDSVSVNGNTTETSNKSKQNTGTITSTVVSCDVHGNNVTESELEPECLSEKTNSQVDFLAQTKYRLCSANQSNGSLKRTASIRGKDLETDIEILSSDNSESPKDVNRNSKTRSNGNVIIPDQTDIVLDNVDIKDDVKVTYQRSPSNRNSNTIAFVDSD